MKLKLTRQDLNAAARQVALSQEQADALWEALQTSSKDAPRFDLINVAYYVGALIIILAMSWFLTISWESLGAGGIFVITSFYAMCFVLAGRHMWYKQDLKIPGGLLMTVAVCMTPLIVYSIQRLLGCWPQGDPGIYTDFHTWIKGSWFWMELATIAASLFAMRTIRFPFLTLPAAFSLWYMSMDITPLLFHKDATAWDERLWVSLVFGVVMLCAGYLIDLKRTDYKDYGFWLYLFGTVAFYSGLAMLNKGNEFYELLCAFIYVGMTILSVLLQRRVLLIFGAIGVIGYLTHLAWSVFQNTPAFPLILSAMGVAIIAIGVQLQRHLKGIEENIREAVPAALQNYLPKL